MIFTCLAGAVFVAFFVLSVLQSMHMFQLNGYKLPTHMRWLRQNARRLLPDLIGAAAAATLAALPVSRTVALGIFTGVFVLLALTRLPKKAKKPLVYTNRVQRMLITLGLLLIIGIVCALAIPAFFPVAAVFSLVLNLIVPFASILNAPIEKGINRYYINDAKQLLKSCPDLVTVGVTGSYGKTSVKYILHTLLQARYDVLKTPESYNTPMGVVKTVRGMLRATHQIFVCEMGARHVGDIQELCDIVHPQYGIITSVGPQHLETFHSLANIQKTKFELADSLPENGIIFVNGEDENIRSHLSNVTKPIVTYGLSDRCDYYATDISASSKGTTFTVHTPTGEQETFTTQMVGAHNVINIVGAIAFCCQMQIPLAKLKAQVRKLEGVPHRLQLIRRNGITIIDDAYNSNPTGSKAAMDALALFDGFRILVTPGMVELGEQEYALNKAFGAYAADKCDYAVLVGKKITRAIQDGLLEAGCPRENIFIAEDLQSALAAAYGVNAQGKEKIILLENDLPDNF